MPITSSTSAITMLEFRSTEIKINHDWCWNFTRAIVSTPQNQSISNIVNISKLPSLFNFSTSNVCEHLCDQHVHDGGQLVQHLLLGDGLLTFCTLQLDLVYTRVFGAKLCKFLFLQVFLLIIILYICTALCETTKFMSP